MTKKKAKPRGKRAATKATKGKAAKRPAKKSAKKSEPEVKKPLDIVQVRENINELVKDSAWDIANGVIQVAKAGQLTSAKYLFEAVGLYPATEQTAARPGENSLAHTLLTRMGLPLEPVVCDEDLAPRVLTRDTEGAGTETMTSIAEEDLAGEHEDETAPVPIEENGEVMPEDLDAAHAGEIKSFNLEIVEESRGEDTVE
jgi:hypothetical protein